MKKGFTLIELLIVMVLVSILVVMALPKYKRSLERGRSVQGLTIVKQAADDLNAQFIVKGNYPATYDFAEAPTLQHSAFFGEPMYNDSALTVTINRPNMYRIFATLENGEIKEIACAACSEGGCDDWRADCANIGATSEKTDRNLFPLD